MIKKLLARAGGVDIQKDQNRKGDTDIDHAVAELSVAVSSADLVIFGNNSQRPTSS